ncbi:hypothetical protein CLAFUW4_13122 [Fulvia fulva]|uniref:Uncharacterized protein n=1 Tax=Passalora fulva TaxID=5499 RepID=A0A9Q8PIY6_PASFU|nr:uncharacterized protein CLAFUR5_12981 [Fulvia fulva]KAK4612039.1 hypothetical protein CLAFUR4_13126 [Fulvia fulva]KAK4612671.1 hypothetical protein CLAFUR0_13131 [Fulvia fulva]UJO23421.1 hypothetical protein CLAFUR5_12981 [Fulvia fulva]WPV20952.1 hypothetical protein CLAFUW4_13122 [Fulvia fulva]WPV36172.1 hypothetical protein CLAFUW7_13130 [Fulvia fulva]
MVRLTPDLGQIADPAAIIMVYSSAKSLPKHEWYDTFAGGIAHRGNFEITEEQVHAAAGEL